MAAGTGVERRVVDTAPYLIPRGGSQGPGPARAWASKQKPSDSPFKAANKPMPGGMRPCAGEGGAGSGAWATLTGGWKHAGLRDARAGLGRCLAGKLSLASRQNCPSYRCHPTSSSSHSPSGYIPGMKDGVVPHPATPLHPKKQKGNRNPQVGCGQSEDDLSSFCRRGGAPTERRPLRDTRRQATSRPQRSQSSGALSP